MGVVWALDLVGVALELDLVGVVWGLDLVGGVSNPRCGDFCGLFVWDVAAVVPSAFPERPEEY